MHVQWLHFIGGSDDCLLFGPRQTWTGCYGCLRLRATTLYRLTVDSEYWSSIFVYDTGQTNTVGDQFVGLCAGIPSFSHSSFVLR